MKILNAGIGRLLAVSSTAAVLAACAGQRADTADERRSEAASDTVYIPGTGDEGGTGAGGAPSDPTVTDTAGEFGDPNAWPTGPLPSDTGVGGAGSPLPDTVWMDTASPEDVFGTPESREGTGTGGGAGPDVF